MHRRALGCGSLKPELEPGTFVLCDQFVDRTAARERAPSTTGRRPPTSRPPTPTARIRAGARRGRARGGIPVVEGGTVVVTEGPRFSTRAESPGTPPAASTWST